MKKLYDKQYIRVGLRLFGWMDPDRDFSKAGSVKKRNGFSILNLIIEEGKISHQNSLKAKEKRTKRLCLVQMVGENEMIKDGSKGAQPHALLQEAVLQMLQQLRFPTTPE